MKKTFHLLGIPSYAFAQMLLLAAVLVLAGIAAGCTPPPATVTSIHISINVDSKQLPLDVAAGTTVQAALQQAGVTLNSLDKVSPASFTLLANNDVIRVTRVKEVFTAKEVTIPFEHQTVRNESLPEGQTLLVQIGVNGTEQVTYRQLLEDNKEISNTVFKTETLVEPQPEVMMVGVQKPFTSVTIPGRLVYLAGGNAWLMETSTGNRRPVVTTSDLDGRIFSLSPKGDWLLFTRAEKTAQGSGAAPTATPATTAPKINSLWAIDLTEKNAKPVNLKIDNVIHFAAWLPGKGLSILYSTVEPRATAPGWQANNDLQMLTFASTGTIIKQEKILDTNAGGVYGWWGTNYAFSSDGALLAYARPDSVGLVDLEKKTQVPLVDLLPFQTGSDWAWVPGLAWAADHSVLYLVTHAPKAGMETSEASPIFHLSAMPFGKDPLMNNGPRIDLVPEVGMFAYPATSPKLAGQGFEVAYLHAIFPEQSENKRYRLAVMDRDGSNRKVIFPPEDFQGLSPQRVVWSPGTFANGNLWIAVNYQGNLWLVDSETGDAQQITGDGLIGPSGFDWK